MTLQETNTSGRRVIESLTNHNIIEGEVWFVNFPLEEDPAQFLPRPVVVLNVDSENILAIKITKANPRPNDPFDTPIVNWRYANLDYPSTGRVSKTQIINKRQFKFKIGNLDPNDLVGLQTKYMDYIDSQQD